MQSAMQRNASHTCTMCCSRCATALIVTPPVSSAQLQIIPLRLPVLRSSAALLFSSRHSHRQSRLPSAIQMSATSDYGANWGEAPESFIVLVSTVGVGRPCPVVHSCPCCLIVPDYQTCVAKTNLHCRALPTASKRMTMESWQIDSSLSPSQQTHWR